MDLAARSTEPPLERASGQTKRGTSRAGARCVRAQTLTPNIVAENNALSTTCMLSRRANGAGSDEL